MLQAVFSRSSAGSSLPPALAGGRSIECSIMFERALARLLEGLQPDSTNKPKMSRHRGRH
jgi:hypothetical protein